MKKSIFNISMKITLNTAIALSVLIACYSGYLLIKSLYYTFAIEKLDIISSGYLAGKIIFIAFILLAIFILRKIRIKFFS